MGDFELAARDNYLCEENNVSILSFSINSSSGACESIEDYTVKPQYGLNTSADDFKEAVFELAREYIDVDKYILTIEEYDESYTYLFTRYIGAYPTCERFAVHMFKTGEFRCFFKCMSDEFSQYCGKYSNEELENAVKQLSSEESEEAIDERIHTMYPDLISYEIRSQDIILLDTDTIGMAYAIVTEFELTPLDDGTFAENHTLDYLIVTLGSR